MPASGINCPMGTYALSGGEKTVKRSTFLIALCLCLGTALLAYFTYPFVTGIVDKRRQEDTLAVSESASKLPDGELVIVMSAEKATELISANMDADFPLQNISVAFGDEVIVLEGVASRDRLMNEELMRKHPNLWVIKPFIPEYAELAVSFTVSVEKGELKVTPDTFTIAEINLPLSFLPLEVRDAVGEMITGKYIPNGFTLRSVEVARGRLTVAMD